MAEQNNWKNDSTPRATFLQDKISGRPREDGSVVVVQDSNFLLHRNSGWFRGSLI